MQVLSSYEVDCHRCKGTRRMVRAQHELGHTDEFCARWCACPPHEIVTVGPFPIWESDPEIDPE